MLSEVAPLMKFMASNSRAVLLMMSLFLSDKLSAQSAVNVTQHHNHYTRDGLYVDPAFTVAACSNLTRDLSFNGTISGNVYAQPLYIEGGPSGLAMVIAVTESNNVYALNAANGQIIWSNHVAAPVPKADLPCGDIDPLGITGTPVVDLATRSLFFDAMTTPDGGVTKKHMIYSLNVDTGTTNTGWPVDVGATAVYGGQLFASEVQNQRGALADLGGYIYVPYGGNAGDCFDGTTYYYGWLVGVPVTNPASVTAWATTAKKGGAWSVGGVASDDGVTPYLATGNTYGATVWGGGESILRFQPGPVFSGMTNDYWTPTNWMSLDMGDYDIGGSGPLIVNVPGASPSNLVVAFGKDGNAYLLNRGNLGGITVPVGLKNLTGNAIVQAGVTYQTSLGTYAVAEINGNTLVALRISPTTPPVASVIWSQSENGNGSPFVTSTDGTNNLVVWGLGAGSSQRMYGFNADTGGVVFSGGGANELMANLRQWNTAIVARGRIYAAGDNKVYAFTVPIPAINLTAAAVSNATFQFSFTNTPGLSFTAYASTNVALPFTNWTRLGTATEIAPGQFQFTDAAAANSAARFYRVHSP